MEGTKRISNQEQCQVREWALKREQKSLFKMPEHIPVDYSQRRSSVMWNRTATAMDLPSAELGPEAITTTAPAEKKTSRKSIFWKVAAAVGVFSTLLVTIAALINPHLLSLMAAHAQKLVSSGTSLFK